MRTISIIAAVAANGAIGFKGGIPWDSPEDRRIFADKTAGGVLVCGKTTAETLYSSVNANQRERVLVGIEKGGIHTPYNWERPQPWHKYTTHWNPIGAYSLEAVAAAYPDRNVWICGGSRLYAEAMRNPLVTEMHISFMDCEPDADAFFPSLRFYSGNLDGVDHVTHGHTHVMHSLHSPKVWARQESHTIEGGVHCVYRAYEPNRYGDLMPCLP